MRKVILRLLIISITLTSCSTFFDYSDIEASYYQGDYEKAYGYLLLNSDKVQKAQGTIIYNLDQGIITHASNDYKLSINSLSQAEKAIEDSFTKSISASVGSYLLNESVRDYDSPFYENIYTNIFLSLNYYHLNNIEDAMVEVRRSLEKLQLREQTLPKLKAELENQLAQKDVKDVDDKLKSFDSSFHSSALSYYLSSLFAFEYGDLDTFRISREKAQATSKLLSAYYMKDKYEAFDVLETLDKNKSVINFIAFSGLAPIKQTKVDRNVLILDEYVDDDGIYHKAYHTNVVYSVPKARGSIVKKIEVIIDGKKYELEPFENLEKIAFETMEQTCSGEYFRAYFRAISREIAKAAVDSSALEEGETEVQSSLFSSLFTIFSYVAEGSGDLRSSHFFPSMSWIGSFVFEPGKYDIQVNYLNSNNNVVYQEKIKDFKVEKNKANLVEVLSAK